MGEVDLEGLSAVNAVKVKVKRSFPALDDGQDAQLRILSDLVSVLLLLLLSENTLVVVSLVALPARTTEISPDVTAAG